ncbi:MAG: Ig-like domain-containing protein [Clostridia bacterium]|nr:Ig-like domain-containing protein [Clostridia bacterium]
MKKTIRILSLIMFLTILIGTICSCGGDDKSGSSNEIASNSDTNLTNSLDDASSEAEPEVIDTRYRATREKKDKNFKYKNVKISCIGDSITQGIYFPGTYRYYLYEYLYSNGATFSMVGSKMSTTDYRLPERYMGHSGYGGWKIAQITEAMANFVACDADIYTFMIGVNDYLGGEDLANISNRYRQMLDALLNLKPNAIVYCCSVAPTREKVNGDDFDLNKQLPTICKEYQDKGFKVYHIDTFNLPGWKENDCFSQKDTVHPNEYGSQTIGYAIGDSILDTVLEINDKGDNSAKLSTRVTGITVDKNEVTLQSLEATTVKATISPSNAEVFTVLWSSSDPKIATVSNSGRIRGIKKGTATITAKSLDGGFKQEIKVTVTAAPKVETTEIFRDFYGSRDIWEGDTDIVKSGLSTWFPGRSHSLNTKESFDASSGFILYFTYSVSSNTDIVYANGYTSYSYGGFTVKIKDCVKELELYKDDKLIGSYKNLGLNPEMAVYQLEYRDGKATLIYAGEKVITARASKPSTTPISITTSETGRCIYATNINLKKFN